MLLQKQIFAFHFGKIQWKVSPFIADFVADQGLSVCQNIWPSKFFQKNCSNSFQVSKKYSKKFSTAQKSTVKIGVDGM